MGDKLLFPEKLCHTFERNDVGYLEKFQSKGEEALANQSQEGMPMFVAFS